METLKKKDIQEVFETGKKISSRYFYLVFKKNQIGYPRFAFIASKKIFKKSTQRNRVKRLLREVVRLLLPKLNVLSCDIILVGKSEILNLKSFQLKENFISILEKLEREC